MTSSRAFWLGLLITGCVSQAPRDESQSGAGSLQGGAGAAGFAAAGIGASGSAGIAGASAGASGASAANAAGASGASAGVAGTSAGSAGAAGTSAGAAGSAGIAGANAGAAGDGSSAGTQAGSDAGDGGAGGGGVAHVPVPSTGCGKAGRPNGGEVNVAGSHIYSFPDSYDGSTPLPLIMALHAAGNENDQLRNITKGSVLEQHFVMAFPRSSGNGWSFNSDSSLIDARFDDLAQNYCIDTSRVFATGHSSGAQMIVQLMCAGDDRYFAIAPVASSAYCATWSTPIPSLIIHGADDRERANTNQDADGRKDLAPYLSSNQCSMQSAPYEQAGCSSSGTQVDPGCVEYADCAQPTIWCQHNDPQYGVTNHGWPCFANAAIDRFFMGFL